MAKIYSWYLTTDTNKGEQYAYIIDPDDAVTSSKNGYQINNYTKPYVGSRLSAGNSLKIRKWAESCKIDDYNKMFERMEKAVKQAYPDNEDINIADVSNYNDVSGTVTELRGPQGRGVRSINRYIKGTLQDTYRIIFDDGSVDYFQMDRPRDGKDGKDGAPPDKPILQVTKTLYASGDIDVNTGELTAPKKPQGGKFDFEDYKLKEVDKQGCNWSENNAELTPPIFSSTCDFYSDDNIKGLGWSDPMQITGDDGKPGTDGNTTEFIYRLSNKKLTDFTDAEQNRAEYVPYYTYYVWDGKKDKYVQTIKPSNISESDINNSDLYSSNVNLNEYLYQYLKVWDIPENVGTDIEEVDVKPTIETKTYVKIKDGNNYQYYIWGEYENEYIPDGWTDSPSGVDENNTTEYCSTRRRNMKTKKWGKWSTPQIWSKYGERGEDGDGVEYIYMLNTGTPPKNPTPHDYENNEPYQNTNNEWLPTGVYVNIDGDTLDFTPSDAILWDDEAKDVTPETPYLWVSSRKYRRNRSKYEITTDNNIDENNILEINGSNSFDCYEYYDKPYVKYNGKIYEWVLGKGKSWYAFSNPSLWGKYGESGRSGIVIRELFTTTSDTSVVPTKPSDNVFTNWSVGFPSNYRVGENVVWGTKAEIYADSHEFAIGYNIVYPFPDDSILNYNTKYVTESVTEDTPKDDEFKYLLYYKGLNSPDNEYKVNSYNFEYRKDWKFYQWNDSKHRYELYKDKVDETNLNNVEREYNNIPKDALYLGEMMYKIVDSIPLNPDNDDIKNFPYLKKGDEYYIYYPGNDNNKAPRYMPLKEKPSDANEVNTLKTDSIPKDEYTNYRYLFVNGVYYYWDENANNGYQPTNDTPIQITNGSIRGINTKEYKFMPIESDAHKYIIHNNEYYQWRQSDWCDPYVVSGLKGDPATPVDYHVDFFIYYDKNSKPNPPSNGQIIDEDTREVTGITNDFTNIWKKLPIFEKENEESDDYRWYRCTGTVSAKDKTSTWGGVFPASGNDGIDGKVYEERYCLTYNLYTPTIIKSDRYPTLFYNDTQVGWFLGSEPKFTDLLIDGCPPKGGAIWVSKAEIDPRDNDKFANPTIGWSDPTLHSGYPGERGPEGPAGRRGVTGLPGAMINPLYCLGTYDQESGAYEKIVNESELEKIKKDYEKTNRTYTYLKIISISELPTVEKLYNYLYIESNNNIDFYKWVKKESSNFFNEVVVNNQVEVYGNGYFGETPIVEYGNNSLKNWFKTPPSTETITVSNDDELENATNYNNLGRVIDYKTTNAVNGASITTHDYYLVYETDEPISSNSNILSDDKNTVVVNLKNKDKDGDNGYSYSHKQTGYDYLKEIAYYEWKVNEYVLYTNDYDVDESKSKIKNVNRIPSAHFSDFDYVKIVKYYQWDENYGIYDLYKEDYNIGKYKINRKIIKTGVTGDNEVKKYTPYLWCTQGPSEVDYVKINEYQAIDTPLTGETMPSGVIDINLGSVEDINNITYKNSRYKYIYNKRNEQYYEWIDSLSGYTLLTYQPTDIVNDINKCNVIGYGEEEKLEKEDSTDNITLCLQEIPDFKLSDCEYIKQIIDNVVSYYQWDGDEYAIVEDNLEGILSKNIITVTSGTTITGFTKSINKYVYIKRPFVRYNEFVPGENGVDNEYYYTYYTWGDVDNNQLEVKTTKVEWCPPFKLQGSNGLTSVGNKGQVVYPRGVYNHSEVYETTMTKAPYVLDPNDNLFYVYNIIDKPWVGSLPENYENVLENPSDAYDNNTQTIEYTHPSDSGNSKVLSLTYVPVEKQYVTVEKETEYDYVEVSGVYYKWNVYKNEYNGFYKTTISPEERLDSKSIKYYRVSTKISNEEKYVYFRWDETLKDFRQVSKYKYSEDGAGVQWLKDQGGDTPATNYANATADNKEPAWVRFDHFDALYASIGIIANGMIGSAVYNNEFMYSQQGKKLSSDGTRVESSNYEDFLSAYVYDGNANGGIGAWTLNGYVVNDTSVNPYNDNNAFWPNVCVNFKTGQMWLGCGSMAFGALTNKNNLINDTNYSNITTQEEVEEWGKDNILTPSERLLLKENYEKFIIEAKEFHDNYSAITGTDITGNTGDDDYTNAYENAVSAFTYHSQSATTYYITSSDLTEYLPFIGKVTDDNKIEYKYIKYNNQYYEYRECEESEDPMSLYRYVSAKTLNRNTLSEVNLENGDKIVYLESGTEEGFNGVGYYIASLNDNKIILSKIPAVKTIYLPIDATTDDPKYVIYGSNNKLYQCSDITSKTAYVLVGRNKKTMFTENDNMEIITDTNSPYNYDNIQSYYDIKAKCNLKLHDAIQDNIQAVKIYTDKVSAETSELTTTVDKLSGDLDGRLELHYGNRPNPFEDEYEKHLGDMWFSFESGITYTLARRDYIYGNPLPDNVFNNECYIETINRDSYEYYWIPSDVPQSVYDKIDGKSVVFTVNPIVNELNYHVGDMWLLSSETDTSNNNDEKLYGKKANWANEGDKFYPNGTLVICFSTDNVNNNNANERYKDWGKRINYADEADLINAQNQLTAMTETLNEWSKDGVLSPQELKQLYQEYKDIINEYDSITQDYSEITGATVVNPAFEAYKSAYTEVTEVSNNYYLKQFKNSANNITAVTISDDYNYNAYANYYSACTKFLDAVSNYLNTKITDVNKKVDDLNGNLTTIDYLTDAFSSGDTSINGGLILSEFVGVKDENESVRAFINGSDKFTGPYGRIMMASGINGNGKEQTFYPFKVFKREITKNDLSTDRVELDNIEINVSKITLTGNSGKTNFKVFVKSYNWDKTIITIEEEYEVKITLNNANINPCYSFNLENRIILKENLKPLYAHPLCDLCIDKFSGTLDTNGVGTINININYYQHSVNKCYVELSQKPSDANEDNTLEVDSIPKNENNNYKYILLEDTYYSWDIDYSYTMVYWRGFNGVYTNNEEYVYFDRDNLGGNQLITGETSDISLCHYRNNNPYRLEIERVEKVNIFDYDYYDVYWVDIDNNLSGIFRVFNPSREDESKKKQINLPTEMFANAIFYENGVISARRFESFDNRKGLTGNFNGTIKADGEFNGVINDGVMNLYPESDSSITMLNDDNEILFKISNEKIPKDDVNTISYNFSRYSSYHSNNSKVRCEYGFKNSYLSGIDLLIDTGRTISSIDVPSITFEFDVYNSKSYAYPKDNNYSDLPHYCLKLELTDTNNNVETVDITPAININRIYGNIGKGKQHTYRETTSTQTYTNTSNKKIKRVRLIYSYYLILNRRYYSTPSTANIYIYQTSTPLKIVYKDEIPSIFLIGNDGIYYNYRVDKINDLYDKTSKCLISKDQILFQVGDNSIKINQDGIVINGNVTINDKKF